MSDKGVISEASGEELVPDLHLPRGTLPPMRFRDLPEPVSWRKMIGPSLMLAGLALGSGEFILWPYITYKAGFVFFWACMLGVCTQFFLNMEITRWTLVTGESAITGFCRLSRHWAWIMLLLNILPWAWPGWATGAGTMLSWLMFGAERVVNEAQEVTFQARYVPLLGIAGLWVVGAALTLGPVVYNTVEKIQTVLVSLIVLIVIVLGVLVIRTDAVGAMFSGITSVGTMPGMDINVKQDGSRIVDGSTFTVGDMDDNQQVFELDDQAGTVGVVAGNVTVNYSSTVPTSKMEVAIAIRDAINGASERGAINVAATVTGTRVKITGDSEIVLTKPLPALGLDSGLSMMMLLGALAFAGAGGSTNLGQSNFIKDKGYGMGKYIGRITSPVTGQQEATAELGYHFRHTDQNMSRWRGWWQAANIEHLLSFFVTCVVCLCLMSLITYSLFYDSAGSLKEGMGQYGEGMNFVWGQATELGGRPGGGLLMHAFLIMGIAILLTTELGVLDVVARISSDIVKVNYLRDNDRWTLSRLYFYFLWGEILLGTGILLIPNLGKPLLLLKTSAAMNGGVMFIYAIILLYMNRRILRGRLRMGPLRMIVIAWSILFFGFFTFKALQIDVLPYLQGMLGF